MTRSFKSMDAVNAFINTGTYEILAFKWQAKFTVVSDTISSSTDVNTHHIYQGKTLISQR